MKRFLVGVMGVGALTSLLAASAVAAGTAQCAADDQVVVTAESAPLMRGGATLAYVPAGSRLQVIRIEGPWVGTAVTVNGRRVGGWLWNGQLATPRELAARSAPTRRYSYQPAAPALGDPYRGPYPYATNTLPPDMRDYVTGGMRSGSPLIMGATKYGRNYWRADRKIIGY